METLTDNLAQNGHQSFTQFHSEIKDNEELLLRKGVYPYEYMNEWDKFEEIQLPSREAFFSSVKHEYISEEDYAHAQHVFKSCKLSNLRDYHDLYLKKDVLLLADNLKFRNMSLECYDLDPCLLYESWT